MKLLPLNCQQCGAPLSVPEGVRHLTCMHCGTQLAVVQEGGAAYTEKLEQFDQRTSEIEQRVEQLDRQQKLTQLDQEWSEEQQKYYVKDQNGGMQPPTMENVWIHGSVAIFSMIAIIIFTLSGSGQAGALCILAFVVGVIGAGSGVIHYQKAIAYQNAEARYRRKREALLKQRS